MLSGGRNLRGCCGVSGVERAKTATSYVPATIHAAKDPGILNIFSGIQMMNNTESTGKFDGSRYNADIPKTTSMMVLTIAYFSAHFVSF